MDEAQFFTKVPFSLSRPQVLAVLHLGFFKGDWYWYHDLNRYRCASIDSDSEYCSAAQAALSVDGYVDVVILDEHDDGKHRLFRVNRQMVDFGLNTLAVRYPEEVLEIALMEADMTTANRLGQCVVYGDVLFPG